MTRKVNYIFIAFLSVFILGSCTTQKRCAKKYPPNIVTKDSVVIKEVPIIIHDTVFIHGKEIYKTDTVIIEKQTGLVWSNKVQADAEFCSAWSQVQNSRIILELIQKDTAIARLIEESVTVKEVYRDRTKVVKEYVVKWYHTAAMWVAIPVIALILAYLVYKAVRVWMKLNTGL
jgi:hypothetical protein